MVTKLDPLCLSRGLPKLEEVYKLGYVEFIQVYVSIMYRFFYSDFLCQLMLVSLE